MKKFLYLLLAICLCSAVGCKKNVKNVEFEEFSTQVFTVMQDVGIIAEIPDTTTGKKAKATPSPLKNNTTIKFLSQKNSTTATFDANEDYLWQTVLSYTDKTETDSLSLFKDVFEQTFYVPIIMGDALATNYGVKNFYGYCANSPWNQYLKTDKNGNEKTTYCYTPQGEIFDKETFITMSLTYNSATDYKIRVKQFSFDFSSLMFFYLDSNDKSIVISYQESNKNNCYVTYSEDSIFGYTITDEQTVVDLKSAIYDEFTAENQDAMRNIKSKAKKTVDEEKWQQSQDKFFGEGSGTQTRLVYTWADEEETVLSAYHCWENQEEFVIPAKARYLLDSFEITYEDGIEPIKTLVIPKSILGVKKQVNGGELSDVSPNSLNLLTRNNPFENVKVEDGSPIFKAGTGHLLDLNNEVVYYVNKAHPTGKLDALAFIKTHTDLLQNLEFYPNLTNSITEVVYENLDAQTVDGDFNILLHFLTNLNKITYKSLSGGLNLDLALKTNTTLVVDVPNKIEIYARQEKSGAKLTLTALNSNCKITLNTEFSGEYVTLNLPWSKQYYDFINEVESHNGKLLEFSEEHTATVNFTADDELPSMTGISIESLENRKLKATLNGQQATAFTIPETFFGYTITEVYATNFTIAPTTITIPNCVTKLSFDYLGETINYGAVLTLNYDGTKAEFKSIIEEFEQTNKFIFNLNATDYQGLYRNAIILVRFVNERDGVDVTTYQLVFEYPYDEPGKYYFSLYHTDLVKNFSESVPFYYYLDQNGNKYQVLSPGYSNRNIMGIFDSIDDVTDLVLTYHEGSNICSVSILLYTDENTYSPIFERTVQRGAIITIDTKISDDETTKYVVIIIGPEMPERIEYEIPMDKEISSQSLNYTVDGDLEIKLYLV